MASFGAFSSSSISTLEYSEPRLLNIGAESGACWVHFSGSAQGGVRFVHSSRVLTPQGLREMNSLGQGGAPSAEFETETSPRTTSCSRHTPCADRGLVQNRHGATRKVRHLPIPVRPPAASAYAKTASVDATASFPLAQNDTILIPKTENPRLRPGAEPGERDPRSADDAAKR
jgi:hypothetical protein